MQGFSEEMERPKATQYGAVPGNSTDDLGHTRCDGYTRDIVGDALGMSPALRARGGRADGNCIN